MLLKRSAFRAPPGAAKGAYSLEWSQNFHLIICFINFQCAHCFSIGLASNEPQSIPGIVECSLRCETPKEDMTKNEKGRMNLQGHVTLTQFPLPLTPCLSLYSGRHVGLPSISFLLGSEISTPSTKNVNVQAKERDRRKDTTRIQEPKGLRSKPFFLTSHGSLGRDIGLAPDNLHADIWDVVSVTSSHVPGCHIAQVLVPTTVDQHLSIIFWRA
jgi:hypothetical protein